MSSCGFGVGGFLGLRVDFGVVAVPATMKPRPLQYSQGPKPHPKNIGSVSTCLQTPEP